MQPGGRRHMDQRDSVARIFFAGAGVALTLLVLLHGTGAFAQTPTPPQPAAVAETGYDAATLSAFVRAAQAVSALRDSYLPKITAANIAERPERAEALFGEMRARMHDAIDAAGLSVERYEAISDRAAQDSQLRARIESILSGDVPVPVAPVAGPVEREARAPARAPSQLSPQSSSAAPSLMARAQYAVDLSQAERRIAELERKLANAEARAQAAEDARAGAAALAARLRADHTALVADFNAEMNARPSAEDVADAEHALAAMRAERAGLRERLAGLSQGLAGTIAALEGLDAALEGDAGASAGAVRRFTRLEPVALSGRMPGFAANQGALQAQLDAAEARNLALHATRQAERAALRREIARISQDIEAVRRELAAVEERLDTAEGPVSPDAVEAVAAPLDEFAFVAGPVAPEPASPAPVVTSEARDIDDGIRAYEVKDFARAYAIWQPLAEAGDPLAQFYLGALYFDGRGVPRNLATAHDWLSQALDHGVERARFLLVRVEKGLARAG